MLKQPALLSKELGIDLDLKKGGKQVVPESWMWRPTHAQLFLRPEGTATPWPMPPPKHTGVVTQRRAPPLLLAHHQPS